MQHLAWLLIGFFTNRWKSVQHWKSEWPSFHAVSRHLGDKKK